MLRIKLAVVAAVCMFGGAAWSAEAVDYTDDVLPILETYCIGCHTADDPEGGFVMETHDAMMRGGHSGAAITPGGPDSSRLLLMAGGKLEPVMPPDDAEGPNPEELAILAAWIEQGAIGPSGELPDRRRLRTPAIPPSDDVPGPVTAVALASGADGTGAGLTALARFGRSTLQDADGVVLGTAAGFPGRINSLHFSADGSELIAASGVTGAFGEAYLIETQKLASDPASEMAIESVASTVFQGHRDTLYAAVLSPDGTTVATGGYDRIVMLWD